jgi:hypothetical protein
MPRGTYFSTDVREEARRLRRAGRSLREISEEIGVARNTLSLWLRDIELTQDQSERLLSIKLKAGFASEHSRFLASEWHRRQKQDRIEAARQQAAALLDSLEQSVHANHIAAAMLYLAEGSKGSDALVFANSNPDIIRYWLYLLRTSFNIDEAKFRLRLIIRADQDSDVMRSYWINVTAIPQCMRVYVDARTLGKSPTYSTYKGVCTVSYNDISLRRYPDAVAHGLIARATGTTPVSMSLLESDM